MTIAPALFFVVFLPAVLVGFRLCCRFLPSQAAHFLVLASLVFYAALDLRALPLLLASICFNFWITGVLRQDPNHRARWSAFGVTLNLLPLVFYKYVHAAPTADDLGLFVVAGVPLGLSFYTFQQITCLFDIQQEGAPRLSFFRHALFGSFFAQIPAGPISRYRDLAPQLAGLGSKPVPLPTLLAGLSLFTCGLGKKLLLADPLGAIVGPIYAFSLAGHSLGFLRAWTLAWTFLLQLYFDFSGYSDMAIGFALALGLVLPVNFNSPLKAISGTEFMDRWHISLVAWVREYLFQPVFQMVRRLTFGTAPQRRILAWATATVVSMVVIGLWHGRRISLVVSWFAIGVLLVAFQLPGLLRPQYRQTGTRATAGALRRTLRLGGNLMLVCLLSLPLLATGRGQLLPILQNMAGWSLLQHSPSGFPGHLLSATDVAAILFASLIVFCAPNTMQIFGLLPRTRLQAPDAGMAALRWRPGFAWGVTLGTLLLAEIVFAGARGGGSFIYARF